MDLPGVLLDAYVFDAFSNALYFYSSMLSAPFIINVWFSGLIVDALKSGEKWYMLLLLLYGPRVTLTVFFFRRWGYGMFAM